MDHITQAVPDLASVATARTAKVAAEVALVLTACGIESVTQVDTDQVYRVLVWIPDYEAARQALTSYQHENRPAAPPPPARPLALGAFRASVAYLTAEFLVAVAASRALFGESWVDRGILEGPAFRAGQWWRPVTSLTLHADFSHLLANLGFGAVFLVLAARIYGWGVALLLMLVAAVTSGAIEASAMLPGASTLGASTAVFAALGLLAPVRWPQRGRLQPWMVRAATFGGAVSLLGLLGAGDARVDVTAHALGFGCGALLGWILRHAPIADRPIQRLSALTAGLVLLAAWAAALAV
jgi:membrane associated rhomboid family serine protease